MDLYYDQAMLIRRIVIALSVAALSAAVVGCSDNSGERVIGSGSSASHEETTGQETTGQETTGQETTGQETTDEETTDKESPDPINVEQDLTVESGFSTAVDSIGTRYTVAGARVTNPNADLAAYDVQVLFNLIGENGDVLDTDTADVPYVGPGASVPVAPLQIGFDQKKVPTDLEVQVIGSFSEDEGQRGIFGGDAALLNVKGPRIEQGNYGSEFTAQVTNPTDQVAELASWSCIYLDGKNIVGGSRSTIVDPIPPGATVQFGETLTVDIEASKVECQVVTEL